MAPSTNPSSPDAAQLFDAVGDGCVLRLHVQPGAGSDAVTGRHGDALRVRVRAKPQAGAANAAVVAYVAQRLGVRRGDIELVSGATSRSKRVRVALAANDLEERLDVLLDASLQQRVQQSRPHKRNSH